VLSDFLDTKPLYYDTIDYTRMPRAYESVKEQLKLPKIIHIIGTNGKGTTGRFLASALYAMGYNTGHYTSPHILEFNERIWLNGKNIDTQTLEDAHQHLLALLTPQMAHSLSYFEYTTLLAIVVYQKCDFIVLEAGLGGEHDATAVFENILTLVTPIDKDHEAFLGDTITQIATTKLNAIQKEALIGKQLHQEVLKVARKLEKEKNITCYNYNTQLNTQDRVNIQTIAVKLQLPEYLQDNLALSIATLKKLNIPYKLEHFNDSKLFGRLTPFTKNILLDVGHNTLAAQSITKTLQGRKYILIYNTYKDKNYKAILEILQPIIDYVTLIDVNEDRIETPQKLHATLEELNIAYSSFNETQEDKNYLVFGSFSVVESFLRSYNG